MKAADIILGADYLVLPDGASSYSPNPIRAKVLEIVPSPHGRSMRRTHARVTLLEAWSRFGHRHPPGEVAIVPLVHVVRPWTDADVVRQGEEAEADARRGCLARWLCRLGHKKRVGWAYSTGEGFSVGEHDVSIGIGDMERLLDRMVGL